MVGLHALQALTEQPPGPFISVLLGLRDQEELVAKLANRRPHLLFGVARVVVAVIGRQYRDSSRPARAARVNVRVTSSGVTRFLWK